jgi:hypothetical protein
MQPSCRRGMNILSTRHLSGLGTTAAAAAAAAAAARAGLC